MLAEYVKCEIKCPRCGYVNQVEKRNEQRQEPIVPT